MDFKTFKKGVVLGVAVLAICALSVPAALAQPVPGGTLDPLLIPKYVTPLVIPPALYDDGGNNMIVSVSVAEFSQQVLPTAGCTAASTAQVAAGGPPIACVGDAFPATTLWGYGDPSRPGPVAAGGSYNNPALTFEVTKDKLTTVTWINGLVDANGDYLPHIIQDQNGVPVIDQTLHWANPNGPVDGCQDGSATTDCRGATNLPYTGPVPMVTHVHGAHVTAESDGYPEAWWLPHANDIPAGYATEGSLYSDINGGDPQSGTAVFRYTNDQPTTTLWYHDHSLGITRLNVYAMSAGFWLIRTANDGETGLSNGTLPGPAPGILGDPNAPAATAIREIPIAIQPKSFNANGSQFYPANRAFFEGLGTGGIYADNTGVNIPFLPTNTSDISPVWNPEAFFNTMTVNGNTWPVLEVAPERYRFRLLNASDSRFMNLSLYQVNGQGTTLREIPFYQIGSEQGLLPQVVRIETGSATPLQGNGSDVNWKFPTCVKKNGKAVKNCVVPVAGTFGQQALLMGPAERPDVIVDFTGRADGDMIVMFNTAPDAPFGGFPDVPADPATTGQVMMFRVNAALANPAGDPSTPPASLVLNADPGGDPKLGASSETRDLALLEEESGLICVTVDAVTGVITQVAGTPPDCPGLSFPFTPKAAVLGINGSSGGTVTLWSDDIETNPALNATETWELWNWSADAHPIHLHLVKFEVVNRQVIGGAIRPPEPWEAGWKDTVAAYPGEITRLKAEFDIEGLYVWHCHILSHEDNEMMVPYYVGDPCNSPVPVAGAGCDGG